MKLMAVLLALLVGLWLWRRGEGARARPLVKERAAAPRPPQAMVRCAHCGIHVPVQDAIAGARGGSSYCSAAHRQQAEGL
ncbi:MAG: hypothetical protein LBP52_05130 [Burkholderiaceae bacterium]|jgi:uncharacterized protein|nr:hypothetical protein [Burkholderiaceae bacterium]